MQIKCNRCSTHAILWNTYDQIWQIIWLINDEQTNAFSTRGKRIGHQVDAAVRAAEKVEAVVRAQLVCDYLNGNVDRSSAIKVLSRLTSLSPRNPEGHLTTMTECALNLR